MSLKSELEKIQKEGDRLKKYDKYFDSLLRDEFGLTKKELHKKIDNTTIPLREMQIGDYFDLGSDDEWDAFLNIICSQKIKEYYHKMMASRG